MKNLYYFLKNLKLILGKNFYPVLLAVLFTIFMFAIFFSSSVNAEQETLVLPNISYVTGGYINTNTLGDTFQLNIYAPYFNTNYKESQCFSGDIYSSQLTIPKWITENYYYAIYTGGYTYTRYFRYILIPKTTDISDLKFTQKYDGSYPITSNGVQFYTGNTTASWLANGYKSSTNQLYNALVDLEKNVSTTLTDTAKMDYFFTYSPHEAFTNPTFWVSNFDFYLTNYSDTVPIVNSSYKELLAPDLVVDSDTILKYINKSYSQLQISMNDFSNPYLKTYVVAKYKLPNSDEWVSKTIPTYPNISTGPITTSYTYISGNKMYTNYDISTIFSNYSELIDGTEIEIYLYYDDLYPYPTSDDNNIVWNLQYTIGDESSGIYTVLNGTGIGGNNPDEPDSPLNPELSGKLDDIDGHITGGFEDLGNRLDSGFDDLNHSIGGLDEHITGGFEGVNDRVDAGFNSVLDDSIDDSSFNINTDFDDLETASIYNFVDVFFSSLRTVFTYNLDEREIVELPVPYVNKVIRVPSDLVYRHIYSTQLHDLIYIVYMIIFELYLFRFSFNIVNKFKSGEFMEGSMQMHDSIISWLL